jgi:mRNA-degrading endonuclease RelE of RelBE toxin-antitoxin system
MSRGRRSRSPYGSSDLRRVRAGRYRVFYTIDEERRIV